MNDSTARFQQRLQLQRKAAQRRTSSALAADMRPVLAHTLDHIFIDAPSIGDLDAVACNFDPADEAQSLLTELTDGLHQQRFDGMLLDMQHTVLRTVANAFGLGKLVSAYDRDGGAVNTVHNVRQGVYATDEERLRFEQREQYDTIAAHSHPSYRKANEAMGQACDAGVLTDSYTGQTISKQNKKDRQLGTSLDHVVAAKNVHDDAGRVLAGLDTAELANVEENLAATTRTVNSKKSALTAQKLGEKLHQQAEQRKVRLAELEASKETWTDKERKEHAKLQTQDAIDIELVAAKEDQAQSVIDGEINRTYYTSEKFIRGSAVAGVTEGARMGMQQTIGVVIVEFLAGVLAEIKDLYRECRSETSLLAEISTRLQRLAKRVAANWKEALAAMRDGFIAGLLSSIATTLINCFVTTAKRAARMIREGLMSLLGAVKLLLLRPAGKTKQEAMHEASKVLVGTAVLVGGIALEELVSKQLVLVPGLGVVAEAAGAAIVGAVTAIATSFAVYALDKADFFGVNHARNTIAVGRALDERLTSAFEALETRHDGLSYA